MAGGESNEWVERYANRIHDLTMPIRGRSITQEQAEVLLGKVEDLRANIVVAARMKTTNRPLTRSEIDADAVDYPDYCKQCRTLGTPVLECIYAPDSTNYVAAHWVSFNYRCQAGHSWTCGWRIRGEPWEGDGGVLGSH